MDFQEDVARAFVQGLSREHRILVHTKDILYDGKWDPLVRALEARRSRKPFVRKLSERIEQDLARIEYMRNAQQLQGRDVSEFLYRY
jgi:hypothetical protein